LRVAADALPRAVEPLEPSPGLKDSLMQTVWAEAEARPKDQPARAIVQRLFRLSPRWAAVAAACVLAIGIGIGVAVSNTGGGGHNALTAKVDHARAPSGAASLTLPAGKSAGAILTVRGLPDPGPGKVYEVWVERGGRTEPAGALFSVSSGGDGSAAVPGSLQGAQAIAVTAERAGGAQHPSETPLLTVTL
jgi:hypothetical protein